MHGFFISHKSKDWALAGRIYDYLNAAGYCPFLDVESLHQGNFEKELEEMIQSTPYFLLVLSPNTFKDTSKKNWVIKEIITALNSNTTILLVATEDFKWPKDMPAEIESLCYKHIYYIGRLNFHEIMKKIVNTDVDSNKINDIVDWQKKAEFFSNTYLTSREEIQSKICTLEARFGSELVECVKKGVPFTGKNKVKSIHMSCYAASLVFAPQINMVDDRSYDRGVLFNIFAELLKDDEFSLEIIITAPNSMAAKESAESEKLGNGRLEEYPEAVFLSSYSGINRLIENDPIFAKAKRERRFKFMVTDIALSCSILQIKYKNDYSDYDHIKIDWYSEGVRSNMDRRCMLIFKNSDSDNYSFFETRYDYIRNIKKSQRLIKDNHDAWIAEWEELKEEIDYED